MYFAYVDESGDNGPKGSATYSLGCVMFEAARWLPILDHVVRYRRFLKAAFGVPVRAELKANLLIHNGGALKSLKLGESFRRKIYRSYLRLADKQGMKVFAVVILKAKIVSGKDPREVAWEYLLQRLERFSTNEPTHILVFHDEGEDLIIRKLLRKARRAGTAGSAFGNGFLSVPARRIVEDSIPRQSKDSYFVQLADLVAYAAFRKVVPPPLAMPAPLVVVPQNMWDELGGARYRQVTSAPGAPPAIVVWP